MCSVGFSQIGAPKLPIKTLLQLYVDMDRVPCWKSALEHPGQNAISVIHRLTKDRQQLNQPKRYVVKIWTMHWKTRGTPQLTAPHDA